MRIEVVNEKKIEMNSEKNFEKKTIRKIRFLKKFMNTTHCRNAGERLRRIILVNIFC